MSAEAGHVAGMRRVALYLLDGDAVPKNDASGRAWLTQAAEAGDVLAGFALGRDIEIPEPAPSAAALARQTQTELNRLGCNAGPADGVWGRNSRAALERFDAHEPLVSLTADAPDQSLLAVMKSIGGRVCPLVCAATETRQGDRCVRKTCPAGQRLSSNGNCVAPPPKGARASGCFVFNGEKFCD